MPQRLLEPSAQAEREDKRKLRVLSRRLAENELTRQGVRVESMTARDLNRAADQYLAAHPELIEEAAKRLITADLKEVNGLRERIDGNAIVEEIKYGRINGAHPKSESEEVSAVAPVVADNGLRRRAL